MNKKIDILIEVSPAINSNKSGVGYYVDGLVRSFSKYNNIYGYYFNFFNKNKIITSYKIKLYAIKLIPSKVISIFKLVGKLPYIEIFVQKKFDFILYTNYISLPILRKTRYGLVVYDLGFIDCPEYIQEKNLQYLKKFCPDSIKQADLILTISQFTKNRIEQNFPTTKGKIIVTYIPPVNKPVTFTQTNTKDVVFNTSKYILFVGSIEPRKNIENLVKAYLNLPVPMRKEYSLILAGGKGWKDESLLRLIEYNQRMGENIITTGYISDQHKDKLYRSASLFVLPSHYEGFGMPVLEAMQYNIPIALSDIPVFKEIAGDSVNYFNKDSVNDIAKVIEKTLTSEVLKPNQENIYTNILAKYSWKDNVKIVTKAIDKCLMEVKD